MSQTSYNPNADWTQAQIDAEVDQAVGTLPPSGTWRNLARLNSRPKLPTGLDAAAQAVVARVQAFWPRRSRYLREAGRVVAMESQYSNLSDARLREQLADYRAQLRRGRETRQTIRQAFAAMREVAWRTLQMKPYPVQIAAGLAMFDGCMVELATGEGKTLSATLPATLAGWRGHGCHIITVNDYLAHRDAQDMRDLYRFAGLRVGYVGGDVEGLERREGYLADVTYTTNKETAADFLRDRLTLGRMPHLASALSRRISGDPAQPFDRLLQRGLTFAIVDEADSVLVDEAVTPLLISGDAANPEQVEMFEQAAMLAKQMGEAEHFSINQRYREIDLTRKGKAFVDDKRQGLGPLWSGRRRSEEMVVQALTALHLYKNEEHYVIQDGKVVIVDSFTGRLMPDRTWRDGLHQAVEAKEGLEVQPPKATFARVSFQRFFRLYGKLAGMTGTGIEARNEFWQVYRMPTVKIPTHRPCIRKQPADAAFRYKSQCMRALIEEIKQTHATGQPLLIGTRNIDVSEEIGRALEALGIEHEILNAVRHEAEANFVLQAGQKGRVTVATNMAGRGTDIKLGRGVAELGGLKVLACERNEASRIDRQLFGRAGRQGDPGSAQAYIAIEDYIFERYASKRLCQLARSWVGQDGKVNPWLARLITWRAQSRARRIAQGQRKSVLKHDDWLDEFLGFAGRPN